MIERGVWGEGDDRRLLRALLRAGAAQVTPCLSVRRLCHLSCQSLALGDCSYQLQCWLPQGAALLWCSKALNKHLWHEHPGNLLGPCPTDCKRSCKYRGRTRCVRAECSFELTRAQEYEVDWGGLVPGRGAKVALQRWRLMQKRVPDYLEKEFPQKRDWIVDEYAPQLRHKLVRPKPNQGQHVD